jgi:hypothetical protein
MMGEHDNNSTTQSADERTANEAPLRDARFVSWSIPKAEWDGFVATPANTNPNLPLIFAGGVFFLLVVGACALFFFAFPTQPKLLFIMFAAIAAMCAPGFAILVYMRRGVMLWRERGSCVWDAQGCVCPLCLKPLCERADDPASCGHGFIMEDQPWIVRYYEALATAPEALTRQHTQGAREMRALRERAARRGTKPRGLFRRFARSTRMTWDAWLGFDQPMWKRAAAHVALAAVLVAVIAPFSWVGAITALWVGGFTFMGYRAVRSANHVRSHLHCAKCKHTLLSADRAKSCPECGTSLADAGSVRSSESRLLVVRWLMGGTFLFLGYWFPIYVAPYIGRALPNDLLFAAAERIPEVSRDTFEVLAARPLSASEQRRLADAMLVQIAAWARGEGDNQLRAAQYIAASVANGTLPSEYAERLARAVCQLRVEIEGSMPTSERAPTSDSPSEVFIIDVARTGDARASDSAPETIQIRMRFVGFGEASMPALAPTVGILSALDIDGRSVWSAVSTDPPTLASDAIATVDLSVDDAPLPAGDYELAVRAFIAITAEYKSITAFDATGAPILPPAAGNPASGQKQGPSLGPWLIEQQYTLRIR